jgi:hypothetical protein
MKESVHETNKEEGQTTKNEQEHEGDVFYSPFFPLLEESDYVLIDGTLLSLYTRTCG